MKIAFVNHSSIQLTDGGQRVDSNSIGLWHYHIARCLAPQHEVTVFHQKSSEGDDTVEALGATWRGVSVARDDRAHRIRLRLEKLRRMIGFAPNPRRPSFVAPGRYRDFGARVATEIEQFGADVVHISNYPQFASDVRRRNPDCIINLHMQCDWLIQLDERLVERRLQDCDLISGCSEYVVDGIRKRFPDHAHKCYPLYNGVDLEAFTPDLESRPRTTAPRVVFVGRLSPEKGLHVLLEALPAVLEQCPDVEVVLVGARMQAPFEFIVALDEDPLVQKMERFYHDGPFGYADALERMIPADARDRVTFINHLPQADLGALYRDADIFVFPSEWHEPFGMPVIEAMASGVPVVTTDSGGIPEFTPDGEVGRVVPRGDAEALGEALCELLADPEKRARMGRFGRAAVEASFAWEHVADELANRLVREREQKEAQ